MKLQKISLFIATLPFFLLPFFSFAQCPSIEAIMVNGCGDGAGESASEFMIINTGGTGIIVNDLTVDLNSNTTDVNGDIGPGEFCAFMTPPLTADLAECPNVMPVGPGDVIPPMAIVVIMTSTSGDGSEYDWTTLCGGGEPIYLLQNSCTRTAGAFKDNNSATTRTTGISTPGCMDDLVYIPDNTTGTNGDYILACDPSPQCPGGEPIHGNNGCIPPPITFPCTDPGFTNPNNQDVCNDYTLPTIMGTNLSGNEHYYTLTMGGGTEFNAGDIINTSPTTLFIFDPTQPCGEESFTITLTVLTANTPTASVDICYTLIPPNIVSENLSIVETEIIGANTGVSVNWYTDDPPTTAINLQNAADVIALLPTPTTVFATITDGTCESAAVPVIVNVDQQPNASSTSAIACDDGSGSATFDLTTLEGDIGTGTVLFYEEIGLVTQINPATSYTINSSPTTIFAIIEGANGCNSTPESVTLTILPPINVTFSISPTEACNMTDVTMTFTIDQAGSYNFEVQFGIPGNFMTQNITNVSDGGSFIFNNITETSEFSILSATDPTAGCMVIFPATAETVTITDSPDITQIADVTACGQYILPAIGFDANAINAAYFTGPNGTGTEFGIGAVFSTAGTTTLFAYAEDAGNTNCSDEESFMITITPVPDLQENGPISICPGDNFDLNGAVTDLNNSGVAITFHSASPANATNQLVTTIVSPAVTTIYFAFADGGASCMDEIPVTVTVNMPPNAFSTTMSLCDEGTGTATFDLTSLNNTVNGGNGNTVNWFENAGPVNPIGNPTLFVASDNTPVFAEVTDGTCPADAVQIILNVTPLPTANPAGPLSACGDVNGDATFDLTTLHATIGVGTINWFENQNLTTSISSPGIYVSNGGMVYATLFDGTCTSLPLEVNLIINTAVAPIDPGEIHKCGSPDATFDLENDAALITSITGGNVGTTVNWFIDAAGTTPLFLPYVTPITTIVFVSVTSAEGCPSTTIPVTLVVDGAPTIIPVSPEACGDGTATFDLESFNNTVNDGSGAAVVWSTNSDGSGVISPANEFMSPTATIFVQIPSGSCPSAIIPINLTVNSLPTANDVSIESCDIGGDSGSFILTSLDFDVSNGTGTVNWFLTTNPNTPVPNPADHIASAGTVFAIVDDGMCKAEATVTLVVNDLPNVSIQLVQGVSCNGETGAILGTTVDNNAAAADYDWNGAVLDGITMPTNLGAGMYFLTVTDENGCLGMADIEITEPEVLIISCSESQAVSTVGGSDGEAAIDISGGVLDYTLDWTGQMTGSQTSSASGVSIISGLQAGNYSLTVTDGNNCETICDFTITDPACPMSLDITGEDLLCNNFDTGTIDLTVNGSSGNVSFAWSPASLPAIEDQINLGAATYTVTVTDESGCTPVIASIILTEPDPFSTFSQQATPATVGNSDGVANVTISGGTLPYEMMWDGPPSGTQTVNTEGLTTITGLPAAFYSLHLVDANGCKSTSAFSIFEIVCDVSLEITGTDPLCFGDSTGIIDLTINDGTAPFDTDWNGIETTYDGLIDLNNVPAGTYGVTVSDADNCMENITFAITDPAILDLTCGEETPISMTGESDGVATITMSGGQSPYVLTWAGPSSGSQSQTLPGTATIPALSEGNYMLTLTDDNGCQTTCDFDISVAAPCDLALDTLVIHPLCFDDSTGIIDLTITGGTSPFQINWNIPEFAGFEDIFDLPSGIYDVTVSDAASCNETLTIEITSPSPIMLSCSQENPVSMMGATDGEANINISGGTALYDLNWTGPTPGMLLGASEGATIISNLAAGEYALSITDQNGCMETCGFNINPAGCNLAVTATGFDASCFDSNDGRIELLVFNGTIPIDFNWSDDALDGMQEPINLSPATYFVTVTDGNTCSLIDTIIISSPSEIILDCAQISPVSAPGETDGSASIGITGGTSPYILTWGGTLSGSQNIASADTITLAMLIAGNYTVTLTDANDCTSECAFEIETACALTLDLSPQDETCPGAADGTITATLTNETTPLTIDWNISVLDGILNPVNLSADTYMLTITDGANCTASDTVTINAGALPSATLSNNGQICADECFTFDLQLIGTAPFIVAYSIDDGNFPALFFFTTMNADTTIEICPIDFPLTTGNTLTLIIEDVTANNCPNPIDLLRTVTISTGSFELIDSELCPDESIQVNGITYDIDMPTGIENMQNALGCDSIIQIALTFFNGTVTSIIEDICEGETIIVNNVIYGVGNLMGTETIESAAGCDSIVNVDLTLIPSITATLNGSTNICAGETTNLVFNSSTSGTFSVQYSGENGTPVFLQNIMDGHIVEVSPMTTTTYSIEFIIISATNCPVLIENSATVAVSNLSTIVNIDQDILCDGEAVGSLSAVPSNGITPYVYLWNTSQTTANISDLLPATYAVVVTDAAGCIADGNVTLTAPNGMEIWLSATPPTCFNSESGSISIDSVAGGDGMYEYSLDGEFYQALPPFPFVIPNVLPGEYPVFIQDGKDCVLQSDIFVPNVAELLLDLGIDDFINLGESTTLKGLTNFTPDTLIWAPLDSLETPNELITNANPTESITYTLTVFDENGCFVSDDIRIIVNTEAPVYIPTVFSPNGDGFNDVFMIYAGNGVVRINDFMIFDRWGNAVFQARDFLANDPIYGWDGKYRGQNMNSAVFVYYAEILLADGRVEIFKGDLTLVR